MATITNALCYIDGRHKIVMMPEYEINSQSFYQLNPVHHIYFNSTKNHHQSSENSKWRKS